MASFDLSNFELRPWGSFGDHKEFVPPKDAQEARSKGEANLRYYKANYAVVALAIYGLTAWFSTYFTIVVLLTGAVGGVLFFLKDLVVGGHKVNETEKAGATAAVALLSLYLLESFSTLIYASVVAALLVVAHAVLRKNTLKNKAANLATDVKEDLKSKQIKIGIFSTYMDILHTAPDVLRKVVSYLSLEETVALSTTHPILRSIVFPFYLERRFHTVRLDRDHLFDCLLRPLFFRFTKSLHITILYRDLPTELSMQQLDTLKDMFPSLNELNLTSPVDAKQIIKGLGGRHLRKLSLNLTIGNQVNCSTEEILDLVSHRLTHIEIGGNGIPVKISELLGDCTELEELSGIDIFNRVPLLQNRWSKLKSFRMSGRQNVDSEQFLQFASHHTNVTRLEWSLRDIPLGAMRPIEHITVASDIPVRIPENLRRLTHLTSFVGAPEDLIHFPPHVKDITFVNAYLVFPLHCSTHLDRVTYRPNGMYRMDYLRATKGKPLTGRLCQMVVQWFQLERPPERVTAVLEKCTISFHREGRIDCVFDEYYPIEHVFFQMRGGKMICTKEAVLEIDTDYLSFTKERK
ncbi:PRA1 family protein 2 [Planoprotostelium fungivorum]|uniref:PRA1 family protein 2 n=1 Tax=Planoprotostelium fungivorum TaxID=1890364 RepID=A0A2P6NFB9_9EUKA|nr:PRA1 family protein 2 [Planoprotostelium fungivorum]